MGLLALMGEAAGALTLIEKLTENPKARRATANPSARKKAGVKIRLRYFPTNSAWAFTFGSTLATEKPIAMGNHPIFHSSKQSAIRAAAQQGLKVSKAGIVGATESASPVVSGNPRGRSKRSPNRPSQATGKTPSKRLKKRRAKTKAAPKGFFANPINDLAVYRDAGRKAALAQRNGDAGMVRLKRDWFRKALALENKADWDAIKAEWNAGYSSVLVQRNPVKHGYDVEANGARIATFKALAHAKEYGQAFANKHRVQVKLRKA